jgi:hypothetical protein
VRGRKHQRIPECDDLPHIVAIDNLDAGQTAHVAIDINLARSGDLMSDALKRYVEPGESMLCPIRLISLRGA